MPKYKITRQPKHNLVGREFGELIVLNFSYFRHGAVWNCLCVCGNYHQVRSDVLLAGRSESCGCVTYEPVNKTHGKKGSRVYGIWCAMLQRCLNPNVANYENYGGRGIKVYPFWLKFENFYAYIGDPPSETHSLDRIDVNGNYEPGNVKWATPSEQQRNRRDNRRLTFKEQTKSLPDWADIVDIKVSTITGRLHRGWSVEDALTIRPSLSNRLTGAH